MHPVEVYCEARTHVLSQGKEFNKSTVEICERVRRPTSVPLIAVFFNGERAADGFSPSLAGHFAAGLHIDEAGDTIRPPQAAPMARAASAVLPDVVWL